MNLWTSMKGTKGAFCDDYSRMEGRQLLRMSRLLEGQNMEGRSSLIVCRIRVRPSDIEKKAYALFVQSWRQSHPMLTPGRSARGQVQCSGAVSVACVHVRYRRDESCQQLWLSLRCGLEQCRSTLLTETGLQPDAAGDRNRDECSVESSITSTVTCRIVRPSFVTAFGSAPASSSALATSASKLRPSSSSNCPYHGRCPSGGSINRYCAVSPSSFLIGDFRIGRVLLEVDEEAKSQQAGSERSGRDAVWVRHIDTRAGR